MDTINTWDALSSTGLVGQLLPALQQLGGLAENASKLIGLL